MKVVVRCRNEIDLTLFINNSNSTIMETMKLIICGEEQELTTQEVQEQIDSLFKEIERLKKENKEKEERSDMWWNSYQDEQKRNARIRKAIEAAKTVLEMC